MTDLDSHKPSKASGGNLRGMVRSAVLSCLLSALLVGAAFAALFATSAAKWVSLLIEPFSLFLTPGVVASLLLTEKRDYAHSAILWGDFVFYFLLLFVWSYRGRRRGKTAEPALTRQACSNPLPAGERASR